MVTPPPGLLHLVLGVLTSRALILFVSTTFSILIVMLMTGIVTAEEVIAILKLEGAAADAFRNAVVRIQNIWDQVAGILSQLLNKLFSFAGVDVDLSKINVDVNGNSTPPEQTNP